MTSPGGKTITMGTGKFWDLIRKLLFAAILILCAHSIDGQIIRGSISDKDSGRPVSNVFISVDDGAISLQSDTLGGFVIEGLAPGRYILRFQHLQFQPELREVLLVIAKESVVDVQLESRAVTLPEITVSGTRFTQANTLNQITVEEVQRYPGTFFDPARFAATFPGVQIVNDQANQLVINGMSPDLMQWHLEGLEIVNPNHLANAGTLSDRPSATGGGVNMLSNQVMSNSSLLTGATSGYGNATSGIMDMYFKDGNTSHKEHTLQIGFLGIEAATEGPFKKGGPPSYIINGRYSTIGLLSLMGVDFGDEKIHFGDISANTQFHLGEQGARLKVFGFFGSNSNKFEAKEMSDWEENKDRYNIDYESRTGVIGGSFTHPIGNYGLITFRSVYSTTSHGRTQQESGSSQFFSEEDGSNERLSAKLSYNGQLGAKARISGGLMYSRESVNLRKEGSQDDLRGGGHNTLIRPYVDFRTSLSNTLHAKLGVGMAFYDNSNTYNFEPEGELVWQFQHSQNLTFQYKLSSQSLNRLNFVDLKDPSRNITLKPIRSHNFRLAYQIALAGGIVETSLNYARIYDMPVDVVTNDYSPLNLKFHINERELVNDGTGNSFSLSLGYRRNFENAYYLSGNGSFISSKYKGSDGLSRSTTYDVGYAFYMSGGKEWQKARDYGMRTWGLNGGLILHGGLYSADIDELLSESNMRTEYISGTFGNVRIKDYYRLDVRLYFRKDKAKHSSTISLDIQNLTSNENDWFSYYDLLFHEVRTDTQLGIIPILSWRLDF